MSQNTSEVQTVSAIQTPDFSIFTRWRANAPELHLNADFSALLHPGTCQVNEHVKRGFDILLSGLLLLFCAPLLIVLAIITKLESPGPFLYRQERIGKNKKPFNMLKIRSMPVNIEQRTGIRWASEAESDNWVSGWGKFLRMTRADELPQLLNIFKGDMSLIGPRPERPYYVSQFETQVEHYHDRHRIRPGLCGYAQVVNPYLTTEQIGYKSQLDFYYIQHWSPALEVWIFFRAWDYVWPIALRILKMWYANGQLFLKKICQ